MSDRQYTDEEIEAALSGTPVTEEVEETPVVEEPSAEEESAPAEEAPTPEPAEAPEAPAEEDDWQLKARKIQAAKDREVAAMQAELQKMREELAEKRGRESALTEQQTHSQEQQIRSVTIEQLKGAVTQDLPGTFEWTVLNRPDLVPALITSVRETEGMGHGIADQMVVEYNEYKSQLQAKQIEDRFTALQSEREAAEAPLRSKEAMEDVVGGLTERFGENFTAVQDQIAQRLESDGRAYIEYLQSEAVKNGDDPNSVVTPELMKEMMVDVYLEIREEAMNAAFAEPAKAQPVPAGAGAIGTSAPGEDVQEDNFVGDFLEGAKGADLSIDPTFIP